MAEPVLNADTISVSLAELKAFLRKLAWFFLIVCAIFGVLAGWLAAVHDDWHPTVLNALSYFTSICTNLTAAAILYLIADHTWLKSISEEENKKRRAFIIKQFLQGVEEIAQGLAQVGIIEHQNIRNVRWHVEIEKATSIDLFVQGWETWVENNLDALRTFFGKGGTFNLYVPNPDNAQLLQPMATRMKRDWQRQALDITETYSKLQRCCKGTRGTLHPYYLDSMTWYCAVRFDDAKLYLSPYEHIRGDEIDSPTFEVKLTGRLAHPHTSAWIAKELDGFSIPSPNAPNGAAPPV